jgi:hypothetical protein
MSKDRRFFSWGRTDWEAEEKVIPTDLGPDPDGTPLELRQNWQGMLYLNRMATTDELRQLSECLWPHTQEASPRSEPRP